MVMWHGGRWGEKWGGGPAGHQLLSSFKARTEPWSERTRCGACLLNPHTTEGALVAFVGQLSVCLMS